MKPRFLRTAMTFVLLMPVIEITGFIMAGRYLGVGITLALLLLSFLAGVFLLRAQGFVVAKRSLGLGTILKEGNLLQSTASLFAAVLLMIPGFVTDIFALLLLFPPTRNLLWLYVVKRFSFPASVPTGPQPKNTFFDQPSAQNNEPPVIDLDNDDYRREPNPSSPWSNNNDRKR